MNNINSLSAGSKHNIPVVVLAGFLGSGKTTFLQQAVDRCLKDGQTPAVIMNEIGDVNLDGQLLPDTVAMEELLSGCICCSIRGDFGLKLHELVITQSPDVVIVECTGIAEPMELVDTLTEVSLYVPVQLTHIITIVDAAHMAEDVWGADGKGHSKKLERLLNEQVRAANMLILNKCDLITKGEADRVESRLKAWNPTALITQTSHAVITDELWMQALTLSSERSNDRTSNAASAHICSCKQSEHVEHVHEEHGAHSRGLHASHVHVTVWTHSIKMPVDSLQFEDWLLALPKEVYRAKGIISFTDTTKRYMFQHAYKATEFIPINPQGDVQDVLVLIGEQMDAGSLQTAFDKLYVTE